MKLSNHEEPCLSGHFCIIKSLKICKSVIFPLAICILLMLEGCTLHKTKKGEQVDEQAIRRVIEQYVESINRCDTALSRRIWVNSDEVSFIAPSGYYTSYQEIRDSLLVGLFGKKFKSRNLHKEHLKIHVNGNNAWAEFFWTFNALKIDGTRHNTQGRETQILKKGNKGEWLLIHIHYSSSMNN